MEKLAIKCEKVDYTRLSNDRFISLMKKAVKYPTIHAVPVEHIAFTPVAILAEKVEQLNKLMSKEKVFSNRKSLDQLVDARWSYIVDLIKVMSNSYNEEKRNAAISLLEVFNSFDKNLDLLPYDAQYTQIGAVLNIWESPENVKHFTSLDLSEDLVALRKEVGDFLEYDVNRKKNSDDAPTPSELRVDIKKHFMLWLNLLESLANLNKDEYCFKVLSSINEQLKEQSAYLKAKTTRSEAEKEA